MEFKNNWIPHFYLHNFIIMIDRESLLNDKEFLRSFKDGADLQQFFRVLQGRAVSQMLEGEMDGHLGYDKHARSEERNSRNGHTTWQTL